MAKDDRTHLSPDDARAILLTAFVANPDLPPDIQVALAKLIAPPPKKPKRFGFF